MANPQNLKPGAHKLTAEEQSMGGKKSGKVRVERRTIRQLLEQFLGSKCADISKFEALAKQIGISSDESIKMLLAATCIINTMKKGSINDLNILSEILGENGIEGIGNQPEDDPLTKSIKEEVKRMEKELKKGGYNADK